MAETNIMGNLAINQLHKFLVYFGGIILIATFFFDVKNIDVSILRHKAFVVLFTGLLLWLVYDILGNILSYYGALCEDQKISYHNAKNTAHIMLTLKIILTIGILFLGLIFYNS